MRAVDIIAKKRDGQTLSPEEIEFFVRGYSAGDIPDYQAAAWAMAVALKGMEAGETTSLTLAMAHSGQVLDLSGTVDNATDKHSSGGVGDKTTIAVAPWVAACGVPVAKMSGRGLAHTGGTIDKLESIPGFRADLDVPQFTRQVKEIGIAVAAQTFELAPADGKLYSLRDATATVDSIPLIASSIMSKKIAAGAQNIVLDVKLGRGAFMKDLASAEELASLMVKIGSGVGRRVAAVISDMNQPLGNAVGNSLEVVEAIETLKGEGPPDFQEHCLTVAVEMLLLARRAQNVEQARSILIRAREERAVLDRLRAWIAAQGGDPRVVEDYSLLPHARIVQEIRSIEPGFVRTIDALQIGQAVMLLGGGRSRKGEEIDRAVGVVLGAKVGDKVERGARLLTIHANDEAKLREAERTIRNAVAVGGTPAQVPPLVYEIIR